MRSPNSCTTKPAVKEQLSRRPSLEYCYTAQVCSEYRLSQLVLDRMDRTGFL
jgi:hypothetical protein